MRTWWRYEKNCAIFAMAAPGLGVYVSGLEVVLRGRQGVVFRRSVACASVDRLQE